MLIEEIIIDESGKVTNPNLADYKLPTIKDIPPFYEKLIRIVHAPIMIDSGARKEAAKSLSEEEVTGALIRSLKSGARNVCVLNAAGEHSIDDEKGGGAGDEHGAVTGNWPSRDFNQTALIAMSARWSSPAPVTGSSTSSPSSKKASRGERQQRP